MQASQEEPFGVCDMPPELFIPVITSVGQPQVPGPRLKARAKLIP